MKHILLLTLFSCVQTLWAAAPTISTFSPGIVRLNTVVTITGTNLTGATSVTIGGIPATSVTVVSATKLTAITGARTQAGPVKVTTPGGTASTASTSLGLFADGKVVSYCDPKVDIHHSLAIRDATVLNDPRAKGKTGAWSFNFLMSQMAPAGMSKSLFIKKWIKNWQSTTRVNGFSTLSSTTGLASLLSSWPRDPAVLTNESDGTRPLDLNVDRFNLIAILFRPDLKTTATNSAGEGRFVFAAGSSVDEIILEYKLPISVGTLPISESRWMLNIMELSHRPFGSAYNTFLQSITDKFTKKTFVGVPGLQNGSGINQVRTNSIGLEGALWKLREFRLTPVVVAASFGVIPAGIGELVSWTTKGNPDDSLQHGSSVLASWLANNSVALLSTSPPSPPPSMWGGATSSQIAFFNFTVTADVKKSFAMTTCKGCHSPTVNLNGNLGTSNKFLQSSRAGFSSFMTGTTSGMVIDKLVWSAKAMPGNASSPFKFNLDHTVTANVLYSDLHFRAHTLINRVIVGFCL